MSDNQKFLASLITSAKSSNPPPVVISKLREICREAADASPVVDLIRMAECLLGFMQEHEKRCSEQN